MRSVLPQVSVGFAARRLPLGPRVLSPGYEGAQGKNTTPRGGPTREDYRVGVYPRGVSPRRSLRRTRLIRAGVTVQGVEKGPDARRRPAVRVERRPLADSRRGLSRPAGEAYSCTLNPLPRAPQHASSQMTQMGPYRRPANAGMTSRANQASCSLNSLGGMPSAQWIIMCSRPG